MKQVFIFLMALLSQQLFGQFVVTGKAVDAESGRGLSMVQISTAEGKTGGLSDLHGNFTIVVPNRKGILNFYFVG